MGSDITKAKDSTTSIFEIIDRKSKIDSSSEEGIVLKNVTGEIELKSIVFTYPARPESPIFKDLSLLIPSGKVSHFVQLQKYCFIIFYLSVVARTIYYLAGFKRIFRA